MSTAPDRPHDKKVLIAVLWQRTSAKGNEYLSGYLGEARVIAFRGEPTADGTPTWNIYLQPGKKQEEQEGHASSARPARQQQSSWPQQRVARPEPQPHPDLDRPFFDDSVEDIGRGR